MAHWSLPRHFPALLVALSELCALDAALANHFILPCTEECNESRWVATGSMQVARAGHTATLLPNGRVLVAGGFGARNQPLDSVEVYDPATGTWSATAPMTMRRSGHVAVLLHDGRVLVVGGNWSQIMKTAEIYDPAAETWASTGSMIQPRSVDAAVVLADGRVLVAGGWRGGDDPDATLASAELYDVAKGDWTPTGSLQTARYGHTLTLLEDGTVLAVRGSDSGDLESTLSSAERYDPRTGTWTLAGDSGLGSVWHTATRLADGSVAIVGGYGGGIGGGQPVHAGMYRFEPTTGAWSRAADLQAPRYSHAATVLPGGEVLVAGGMHMIGPVPVRYTNVSAVERYDADVMMWRNSADLMAPRSNFTLTLLPDGTVLAAGGVVVELDYRGVPLAGAERYSVRANARGSDHPTGDLDSDDGGDHSSREIGDVPP